MKPSDFWLRQAQSAFRIGKTLVIRDGDPRRLHKRLYKAARRRGYTGWHFAQDWNGGVVVKYKYDNSSKEKTHGI